MTKKRRVTIPKSIEAQVLYLSNFKCCCCENRGDHIHHMDGNPQNNNIDNLVFLCFNHHVEASEKSPLRKKLSKEVLAKYREHHYKVVETKRKKDLEIFDKVVPNYTEEKLLTIAKNAIIILEIDSLKQAYYDGNWGLKYEILESLYKYINHNNNRLIHEILEFLSLASNEARTGMPFDVANSILCLILNYMPQNFEYDAKEEIINLSKSCISIGFDLVYDAFIYLNDYRIGSIGLEIIRFIYEKAKSADIKEVIFGVESVIKELESTLNRPERPDLEKARVFLSFFCENIENRYLDYETFINKL